MVAREQVRVEAATCHKCKENAALYYSRVNGGGYVCQSCFTQYIFTKTVKRMETLKPRGSQPKTARKILLPISLGSSSVSLLHILDTQIQGQIDRMGRSTYELIVAHVQLDATEASQTSTLLESIRTRYSRHTYVTANLSDTLQLPDLDWSSLDIPLTQNQETDQDSRLLQLFSSLPSATARADLTTTLTQQLLVSLAKVHSCTSILFGHSTTRLAEKVLTSTASGRGFSLPWQVSDGPSPYGVDFGYPLRDLLTKEIVTFVKLIEPSLTSCIIEKNVKEVSASSKNTTIDELMAQYFASVEENFPSIVANVVRTSSKLKAPDDQTNYDSCGLCGLPIEAGTDGIFGWGGDQSSTARVDNGLEESRHDGSRHGVLCYGCSRSVNG